jgi:prepilin-type N-terminal cleavage/methylation domain-containing protein
MMSLRKKRGFTLIELLVVVSIIALLVSILMPALSKAREAARRAKCAASMHNWGLAASAFLGNYGGLPRGQHEYSGNTPAVNPNATPPASAKGQCYGYFLNDTDEDLTTGDWKFFGTPWKGWIASGLATKQMHCPSAKWLKKILELWENPNFIVEEEDIAFLKPIVQKPFSGSNAYFRRWTRVSYLYVGNVDTRGNLIINPNNPRSVQHPPMVTPSDRGAADRVLGADMAWWDIGGGWAAAQYGLSHFWINHPGALEGEVGYENVLYGDGHVAKSNGEFFENLEENYLDFWTYQGATWNAGPYIFW